MQIRKKILSCIAVALAVLIQASTMPGMRVIAEGSGNSSVTDNSPFAQISYTLTDANGKAIASTATDANGNPIVQPDPSHPVDNDSAAQITFNFTMRGDLSTQSVPVPYLFEIPKQLTITKEIDMYLPEGSDATTAYALVTIKPGAAADGGSQGTIQFYSPVKDQSNVAGSFTIGSGFNKDEITNTWPVELPFSLNGVSDPVTVYFNLPAPTISKSGSFAFNAAGDPVVTWHVAVNSTSPATTVRGGVLTDTIDPSSSGQTYVPGSFTLYTDSSYTTPSGTQPPASQVTEPSAGNGYQLKYTLDSTVSQTLYASYQTKVDTAHLNGSVSNTADLGYTDNGGNTATVTASSQVNTPVSYLTKSASYNGGQILYTITLNPNQYPITGAQVTDSLPAGLTIASVKMSTDASESDAQAVSTTDNGTAPYYTYDSTSRAFVYNAHDTLSGKTQTLYIRANLPADYFQRNNAYDFTNTATITGTGVYGTASAKSGNPGPGSTVIVKSVDSGNSSLTNQTITWNVTVGSNSADLPHAVFSDVIDPTVSPQQSYKTGSLKIYSDSGRTQAVTLNGSLQEPSSANGYTLQYDFGDMPAGTQYYLTYQTAISDAAAAGNTALSFPDTATLDPDGAGPVLSSSSTAKYTPTSDVLKKTGLSYDYNTHTAQWKINVNNSQVSLTGTTPLQGGGTLDGVLVEDDLSGAGIREFALNADSITVNGTTYTRQTAGLHTDTNGNALPDAGQFSYDSGTGKLWINLGQLNDATPANRSRVIQFSMTIPDQAGVDNLFGGANANPQVTVSNTATLYDTQKSGVTATGNLTINNTLAGKTAQYTTGNDYIDWTVPINQNGIDMAGFTMQDTLQTGLELDTSTVKLYSASRDAAGNLTAGAEASLTGAAIHYDAATGEFDYTVPASTKINTPYVLTFRTYVDTAHSSSTFHNSLSLQSNSIQWQSSQITQTVYYNSSSGTITGETGSITVTKQDAVTKKALAGAQFELLDSYGNVIRSPITTDDNGQAVFSKLRFAPVEYTLREVKAPDGYQAGADYTFTIPGTAGQKDIQYSYTNQPLTAAIQVTKTDSRTGEALDGAVFALTGKDVAGQTVNQTSAPTGKDGVATFSGVPVGNYTISEQTAPAGYAVSGQTIPVAVTDADSQASTYYTNTQKFTLSDDQLGQITVTKTDGQAGKALAGAQFELTDTAGQPVKDVNGQTVAAQTTDGDGKAVFGSLPFDRQNGTAYQVKEVSAPEGYTIDDPYPATVTLTAQGPTVTQQFTDTHKPGTVRVQKTDESGNPLSGATFALVDSKGRTAFTATTGQDGYATFAAVPLGSYTLKETVAPAGYLIGSQTFSVQVTDENYTQTQMFQFMDLPSMRIPSGGVPQGDLLTGNPAVVVPNPKTGDRHNSLSLLWWGLACSAGAAAAAAFLRRRRHLG